MGNTRDWARAGNRAEDHPHLRGEYSLAMVLRPMIRGSPPLAWGILCFGAITAPILRITPTCVGNTSRQSYLKVHVQDHPHLRGEYRSCLVALLVSWGSPPLAWGIPDHHVSSSKRDGITPTCVGNTVTTRHRATVAEDHPHLRGEYRGCSIDQASDLGSPPLAWGIHWETKKGHWELRITPTCVGNTLPCFPLKSLIQDHPHLRGEY